MGYRTIEKDIKSGVLNKPAPILLYGEEHFLVDLYTRRLEALFSGALDEDNTDGKPGMVGNSGTVSAASALDVSVFYGADSDDEAIIAALETFPMLSPLRIVIVKGHPGLAAQKTPTEKGSGGIGESSGSFGDSTGSGSEGSAISKGKNELAEYIAGIPDTSRLIFSSDKINKTRSLFKAIQKIIHNS